MSQAEMPFKSARASLTSIGIMIALTLATVAIASAPALAQSVQSCTIDARLRADDTLDVKEQITIYFGEDGMLGLYRVIPTGYSTGQGTHKYQFKLESVAFDQGSNIFQHKVSDDAALIRIGDPYRKLVNMRILTIHYLLRNVVDFSNGAHLRWEAFGNSWPIPTDQISLTLRTPFNAQTVPVNCSAVIEKSSANVKLDCMKQAKGLVVEGKHLAPGDILLLNLELPPNSVMEPGLSRKLGWFLSDWWPALIVPLLIFAALTAVRWTCGRIQEAPHLISDELALPENLSPAELGTLLDDHCDLLDITATVFDLAARGYLNIEEVKSDNFVSFSNRDYLFKRVKPANDPSLAEHEKVLMAMLFSPESAPGDTARLSEVKTRFFEHHPQIEAAVYKSLITKGQLLRTPAEVRISYIAGGSGLLLAGLMFTLLSDTALFATGIGLIVGGLITLFFAPTMPSRTILGCKSLRQTKKFRGFLLTAKKEQIKALARGDGSLFGRFLPYAVVMGAADRLADGMKDAITSEPNWYRPYYDGPNGNKFSPEGFVTNLGSGMRTIERSFAFSAPSSLSTEKSDS
jgi:Predicted membrane protein (DUF2207)